jgi:sugar O-acyltransferase (sialic acid O-acetyltransferase NeuD family)
LDGGARPATAPRPVVANRTAESLSPPTACRRIFIVGAGGFGREVWHWLRDAWPESVPMVTGFLSADPKSLDGKGVALPIVGDPDAFVPEAGDVFLLAIGIPQVRRRVAESLESRGAVFATLVHPTAIVAPSAVIGHGSILCPFAIVSDAAVVGRFTLVNFHASLGHDATTGAFCVLSPYATLGGGAHLGEDVFMGMHSSVGPAARVGGRSKISANSCALVDTQDDALVFGSPGRVGPLLTVGRG